MDGNHRKRHSSESNVIRRTSHGSSTSSASTTTPSPSKQQQQQHLENHRLQPLQLGQQSSPPSSRSKPSPIPRKSLPEDIASSSDGGQAATTQKLQKLSQIENSFSSLGSGILQDLQDTSFTGDHRSNHDYSTEELDLEDDDNETASFFSANSDINRSSTSQMGQLPYMEDLRITPDLRNSPSPNKKSSYLMNFSGSDISGKTGKDSDASGIMPSPVLASLDVPDRLNQDRFTAWCFAFISLNFDLEIGQNIDFVYPKILNLSTVEKSNIKFSSFPDSSSIVGDTVFSFRFEMSESTRAQISNYPYFNTFVPNASLAHSPTFMYGYVFFRQQKDGTNRRGYLQKSLCVLSVLPFPGLFLRLVSILGPLYMNTLGNTSETMTGTAQSNARVVLEAAAHAISQWPLPSAGNVLDLPFFGTILQAEMPNDIRAYGCRAQLLQTSHFASAHRKKKNADVDSIDPTSPTSSSQSNTFKKFSIYLNGEQILPTIPCTLIHPRGFFSSSGFDHSLTNSSIGEIDLQSGSSENTDLPGTSIGVLFRFLDVLDHLWTIWELMLLGEPLVVMGKSQTVVSECVWWISQLIRPIPYAGDFRPYFTIQDADFRRFTGIFRDNGSPANSFYKLGSNGTSSLSAPNSQNSSQVTLPKPHSVQASPNSTMTNLNASMRLPIHPGQNAGGVYLTPKTLSSFSLRSRLVQVQTNTNSMCLGDGDSRAIILGVTNPFFSNAMEGWPHVLRVEGSPLTQNSISKKLGSANSSASSLSVTRKSASSGKWGSLGKSVSKSILDQSSGLTTSHKPFLTRDKKLIKALLVAFEESTNIPLRQNREISKIHSLFSTSSQSRRESDLVTDTLCNMVPSITSPTTRKRYKGYALNEILRRHFVELTDRFLIPFNRYFTTLMPTPVLFNSFEDLPIQNVAYDSKNIVFHAPPPISTFIISPFDVNQFTNQLASHGPPSLPFASSTGTSKSLWMEMYNKFLESPNFISWLRDRKRVSEYQIRSQYLEQLQSNNSKLGDIDLFLLLRQELVWTRSDPISDVDKIDMPPHISDAHFLLASGEMKRDLEIQAKMVWARLPSDVKAAFKRGLFNRFLQQIPVEDEDFILVA